MASFLSTLPGARAGGEAVRKGGLACTHVHTPTCTRAHIEAHNALAQVRPASAAAFADELETLLTQYPPDGCLPLAPTQYGAHLKACVVDGAPSACWVLTDSAVAIKRARIE